jgi:uncharacterized membrane-anchored protein
MGRTQTAGQLAPRPASAPAISGAARLDRRTKLLAPRLRRGDIAVIDHPHLDRVSAEDMIAARVAAVINCSSSVSHSYPNLGPLMLVEAGIPLIDLPDDSLFERCREGQQLELRAGSVRRGGELLAQGRALELDELRAQWRSRQDEIAEALERFAINTVEHMREELELLEGRLELPPLSTELRERHVLVVVRGAGYLEDLRALRPYLRQQRPVIIAVDGAAESLLESGLRPDMIIGDMDSAGERALRCGAELVAHAYLDGRSPARERLERLGVAHTIVAAPGTSEDLAMLIAAQKGASLIVCVGAQLNLVAFLDRDRAGASSTFLTRLRIGEILVDAKGVSSLYRPSRRAFGPRLGLAARRLRKLAAAS